MIIGPAAAWSAWPVPPSISYMHIFTVLAVALVNSTDQQTNYELTTEHNICYLILL